MHVVPSTEGKLLPCGFTQHSPGAVPGEILAGCREAEPPPRCDFSAANGSIVLGGLGALCRSGTSLAPAAPWSYQIEPGSPLLPPSHPLHAQPLAQGSFGSHPRGEEHCPGPQGSFEHSQCVCPAPAPEHPPEHSAPWVSVVRRAQCWEGNGQHDPIHGFLSIKLALLPLSLVKWMGLDQLPEKGISQCSVPWEEGAGSPTCGCSPACLRGGGVDKRHPKLQPWELLVLATQPQFLLEAFITQGGNPNPLAPWAPPGLASWKEREAWKGRESRGKTF